MWVLECDGSLFNGKRLWLRPGSAYLFGRTKQPHEVKTDSYVIEGKSVSKKHLKLEVPPVTPGTGSKLHKHTELLLEDFSKFGTTVDGEKISQSQKILKGNEHVIQVAKYEHLLRIKWQPVVLTVANLSKEERQSADPVASFRSKLEPFDIKFVQEYIHGETTHVVASKRNIPQVLQALCSGSYVVTRAFIDAVVAAAQEEAQEEGQPRAPLERDFEAAWPDAMNYVPPPLNEPDPMDAKHLSPNPERAEVFYGYTFVFVDKSQYENLQAVINAGSGKAILFESFKRGHTRPRDLVTFVKNVAGEKGVGELRAPTAGHGVVVVRLQAKDDWDTQFVQEVDRELNQRSVAQNEFLKPILLNDARDLRRQLSEDLDASSSAAPAQTKIDDSATIIKGSQSAMQGFQPAGCEASPPVAAASLRKRGKRPLTQSRFKSIEERKEEDLEMVFDETMPEIDEDAPRITPERPAEPARDTHPSIPRKRLAPELNEDQRLDELLPAQAALKKRKLETAGEHSSTIKQPLEKPVQKPRMDKEKYVDYLEEARKKREEDEGRARAEKEALKEAMDGMEISGPANLITIEDMPLRSDSGSTNTRANASLSSQWRDEWNGRPNFKRFQRKGQDQPSQRNRVIVPLEETKKKDFGIGDEYWVTHDSMKNKGSQRETSQTLRAEEDADNDGSQLRRRSRKQPTRGEEVEIISEPMHAASEPPSHRTRAHDTQNVTQTERQGTRKRPAPEPVKEPPARRARTKPAWVQDNSEEDDDELAFPKARKRAGRR